MTAFEVGLPLGFENVFLPIWLILVGLLGIAFIVSKYDVMHPFVILMCTMTFSFSMMITKADAWHMHFSTFAGIILVTSLITFGIGALWSDWNLKKIKNSEQPLDEIQKLEPPLHIKNIIYWSSILLMIVFLYFNFNTVYMTSLKLGNTNGYSGMIRTVRLAQEHGLTTAFSRWYSYRDTFSTSFTYFSLYIFFYNIFFAQKPFWQSIKYLMPVVFYIPMLILSGGRLGLLQFVVFVITVSSFLYQKKHNFDLESRKITIVGFILSGIGFLLLFLGFGFFTGKVSFNGRDPFTILVHYAGLSMPAFSSFLNSSFLEMDSIGNSTLWDLTRKFAVFGLNVPAPTIFLTFIDFNGTTTNVYTAMRRYINDYGYIGMYFIMFFLGMFYTAIYNLIRFKCKNSVWIIIYAMICLPLYFSINDDMFLAKIIKTSELYQMGLIYIFYRFGISKIQITSDNLETGR